MTRGRPKSGQKPMRSDSAVEWIANELRDVALDLDEGAYLGSEESLISQFGVSAPTLRQAARLLEHEQVLKVKRGVSGGYYARRPNIDALTRVAATYLRGNHGTLEDVMALMRPLSPVWVDLAMHSRRKESFKALKEFAAPATSDPPPDKLIDDERRFISLLIEITENAPLRLILAIFNSYGSLLPRSKGAYDKKLARRIHDTRAAFARALIARDAETTLARKLEHQELVFKFVMRSTNAKTKSASTAA